MSVIGKIGRRFRSIIINICILLSWITGAVLVLSAYCGYFDPKTSAKFAIIGLAFPYTLAVNLLILIFWLVCRKWLMVLFEIAILGVCYSPILTFSPLNFNTSSTIGSDNAFKVLTYNVMNFNDMDISKENSENRTLRYILDTDADIVLLQEGAAKIKMDKLQLIASLMPEVEKKYPYRERRQRDLVIMSKYPYEIDNEEITTNAPQKSTAYRLSINGKELYIINVHLESIKLTGGDKALYRNITDLSKSTDNLSEKTMEDVKSTLLTKLAKAFRTRAKQAKDLKAYIDSIGNKNVILCGDFNDTPASFAYNTITGGDMSDAYKDCALGPTITFHANRFYFRIDHILYKGNIKALDIERGDLKSSDHYPLLATFQWD